MTTRLDHHFASDVVITDHNNTVLGDNSFSRYIEVRSDGYRAAFAREGNKPENPILETVDFEFDTPQWEHAAEVHPHLASDPELVAFLEQVV